MLTSRERWDVVVSRETDASGVCPTFGAGRGVPGKIAHLGCCSRWRRADARRKRREQGPAADSEMIPVQDDVIPCDTAPLLRGICWRFSWGGSREATRFGCHGGALAAKRLIGATHGGDGGSRPSRAASSTQRDGTSLCVSDDARGTRLPGLWVWRYPPTVEVIGRGVVVRYMCVSRETTAPGHQRTTPRSGFCVRSCGSADPSRFQPAAAVIVGASDHGSGSGASRSLELGADDSPIGWEVEGCRPTRTPRDEDEDVRRRCRCFT